MPKIPKSEIEAAQRLSSGASTDAIREAPRLLSAFAARTLQATPRQQTTVETRQPPSIQTTTVQTQKPIIASPNQIADPNRGAATVDGTLTLTLSKNGVATDYLIPGREL